MKLKKIIEIEEGVKDLDNDWKELKLSSNGLPTWDSFIPYILVALNNGEETTRKVIVNRVLDILEIPVHLREQAYSKNANNQGILANRIGFALTDLYRAKAIHRPKRAIYQITEKGNSLLSEYGDTLSTEILQNQPEYKSYMQELNSRNKRTENAVTDDLEDSKSFNLSNEDVHSHEMVEAIVNERNNEVKVELLNKIQETDPHFFESLVVKLLDTMGYSGRNGSMEVTNQSNDGGIDGIINQDPLGTRTVYLQLKLSN